MSTLELEEQVAIAAPPARVFETLLDPEVLVACLPGAALDELESETAFLGNVKVKVGTVTLAYKGRIELTTVDREARRIEATGEGREKGAAGRLAVTLEGAVAETDAGALLTVSARVKLAGKIVRFGRGMLDAVTQQLFQEFAGALRSRIEAEAPAAPGAGAGAETSGEPAAAPPATSEGPPIRALPLLLRSFWAWLRGLFGGR